MGNQDDRGSHLFFELAHQLHDLRLNRNVQSGRWLIGNNQLGLDRQNHRDHDSLAHTAGKLVGILPKAAFRFGDADRLEHFQTALMRLFFSQLFVRQKHFGHLRLDPVNGV